MEKEIELTKKVPSHLKVTSSKAKDKKIIRFKYAKKSSLDVVVEISSIA